MARNLFLVLLLIIGSKAVRAGQPLDDFGSVIDENRLNWLKIEEDVARTSETLKAELAEWRKDVQSRQLASIDNSEQENFELWLELESQETDDPTYWIKETNKLGY